MPIFVTQLSKEEIQRRWDLASAAKKAELRRSLRDPEVWLEQTLSLIGAAIKAFCLVLVVNSVFWDKGVTVPWGLSFFLSLPIVALNPWQMFWRYVPLDRASAAYQRVIDELNEKL
ncbi:hypothetical protein ACR3H8_33390 [Pseudomonas aeruginosa]|uniref:hypothetical protein n=1 Tax=Pseudomonas aeruginosa group TaxID=136841 RepID=UPI0003BB53EF|nr:hypothetical protein [Pseudomonas aeruginosa]EIU2716234.1 hypothetical protein [Pseudomonas aeruginosa]EIU2863053.1 hypothetical protein [Pseudomonas aeruginosa]ELD5772977.1 hypothetical protein [Pseudomonas aeruginosa]ERW60440.1 hypothetical protein Q024_06560 [Pseudomonas aeruginosa BWHPSA011]ETV28673.1 hypothetical protein Q046_05590 [Pseudomonas aeruginosa BWHPSA041]